MLGEYDTARVVLEKYLAELRMAIGNTKQRKIIAMRNALRFFKEMGAK